MGKKARHKFDTPKDIEKILEEGLDLDTYLHWLACVILGHERFEVMTSRGDIEDLPADAKTRIVYGKEYCKLKGWYEIEEEQEEGEKIRFYIPDNGKVAG